VPILPLGRFESSEGDRSRHRVLFWGSRGASDILAPRKVTFTLQFYNKRRDACDSIFAPLDEKDGDAFAGAEWGALFRFRSGKASH
jgi:hypothetical protein